MGTALHKDGRYGPCNLLGPMVPEGCLQSAPGLRRRPAAALEAQSSLRAKMGTLGISHFSLKEVQASPLALMTTKS